MITQAEYRALALSMPEAVESSHFESADFRVRNKIFATLRERDGHAVVKLTPDEQRLMTETMPGILASIPGGWGLKGWTRLRLDTASAEEARHVLMIAWRNVAPKKLLKG
jgi:hypothetical protein